MDRGVPSLLPPAKGRTLNARPGVEPSGRHVFRVWFGESFHPRGEVETELARLGGVLEWSSANLLAVDAADDEMARTIADYLHAQEEGGRLMYETGRTQKSEG